MVQKRHQTHLNYEVQDILGGDERIYHTIQSFKRTLVKHRHHQDNSWWCATFIVLCSKGRKRNSSTMITFLQVRLSSTGKTKRQRPTMFIKDLIFRKRIQSFLKKNLLQNYQWFSMPVPNWYRADEMIEQQALVACKQLTIQTTDSTTPGSNPKVPITETVSRFGYD